MTARCKVDRPKITLWRIDQVKKEVESFFQVFLQPKTSQGLGIRFSLQFITNSEHFFISRRVQLCILTV